MVSIALQDCLRHVRVTDMMLSALVTAIEVLSKEEQETYKEDIRHLQLFLANATNTVLGNPTEIIDFDYWEVTHEPTNPFWGGEYSNNEEDSKEHSE